MDNEDPKERRLVIGWRSAVMVILTSGLCGLSGCVTWTKDGATDVDLQRDKYECERDATQQASQEGMGGNIVMIAKHNVACMRARGWEGR